MKKLLRWAIYLVLVLVILAIIAAVSINPVARSLAERRIQEQTGMETSIGSLRLGFRDSSVHLRDLKMINPPEFGGGTFLSIPELYVELDSESVRSNRLRFHKIRVDLAELHVVEDKEGRKNTDVFVGSKPVLPSPEPAPEPKEPGTNSPSPSVVFGGIDHLEISLGRAKFTSERYPKRNYERELGVRSRVFENLQTEKDLETVGVLIVAQIGMSALLERFAGTESSTNVPVLPIPAATNTAGAEAQ